MNRIKHLVILSIAIIILALVAQSAIRNDKVKQKAQRDGSFAPVTGGVVNGVRMIDEDILLDDNEKPITKTTVGSAGSASSVPTTTLAPSAPVIPPKPIIKPYITAESYIVANLKTGEIYSQLNPDKVVPIASVSKLYTALVVKHVFDLEKEIIITQPMLETYGDSGGLKLGEKFKPEELLYALLLVSSNDSAEAFAQSFGYQEFMSNMNGFAKEIGMNKTYFRDPSGLSAQNVSNASDLFALTRYLYTSEKSILDISKTSEFDIASSTVHGYHHYININPFTAYSYFTGGKTGRTNEAKEAMVSIFDQTVGDITYPIAVIILRSDLGEREMNTEKLLGLFIEKVSVK